MVGVGPNPSPPPTATCPATTGPAIIRWAVTLPPQMTAAGRNPSGPTPAALLCRRHGPRV